MINQAKVREAGEHMWHRGREGAPYANLPPALAPADVEEAYAAQAAFHRLAMPVFGGIGGWKIATTTKVMQELMGIGHPCAGAIFASRIHQSPARLQAKDYVSLKIEFELAFRLAADLPASSAPFEPGRMLGAVDAVMPAGSVIFYGDDEQKKIADSYIAQLNQAKAFPCAIVTQVVPLKAFYPAEAYHQDYAAHHPDQLYIVYNDAPKVAHLKQQFPDLYTGK